jgi:hypothetical protein
MSLNFAIRITCELKYDTPQNVIDYFLKCQNGETITQEDESIFPWDADLKLLFHKELLQNNPYCHFLFEKQNSLFLPENRKNEANYYTFHLETEWHDDDFYENGYQFLCWLSTHSKTVGFVGTQHETSSLEKVTLLFFRNGLLEIQNVTNTEVSRMSIQEIL